MSAQIPSRPPATLEQKCNYCGGSGKWTRDIMAGLPPESINCPHCHGSGKAGYGNVGEPTSMATQPGDE